MRSWTAFTDEELLTSQDTEAFDVFYDRHAASLLSFFARRLRDPHVAADLTAETFASAIVAQRRYAGPGRRRSRGSTRSRTGGWSTTSAAERSTPACATAWRCALRAWTRRTPR
jgi:hypothetical protein